MVSIEWVVNLNEAGLCEKGLALPSPLPRRTVKVEKRSVWTGILLVPCRYNVEVM